MTVALTRHFENLRSLLSCYSNLRFGNDCTLDLPTTVDVPGVSAFQNKTISLLMTPQAREISKYNYRKLY